MLSRQKIGRGIRGGLFLSAVVLCGAVFADGTESLGLHGSGFAQGSGFAVGGTGLFEYVTEDTFVSVDGEISVAVPAGSTVEKVYLYWTSEFYPQTGPDDELLVNGQPVVGESIGGPTNFFSVIYYETFRADITALGVVAPGNNVIEVSGADSSYRTTGAGVLVAYDDGTGAELQVADGQDLAYWPLSPPLDATVPITFTFAPAAVDRQAHLPVLVGSVGDSRPNVTEITTGGITNTYYNLFTSLDGSEWDSQIIDVEVPAGASSVTIHLLSAGDGSGRNPASLDWVASALAIEEPEIPCQPCEGKVSELTLQYNGNVADALVEVVQKKDGTPFAGVVQPGEQFSFVGLDKNGTLGTEISIYVNGALNTKIHTSCSQPIGPGQVSGDFEIIAGESRNGGPLCPIDVDDDCACEGKVSQLTLQYNGTVSDAQIDVIQKKDSLVAFSGVVQPGGQFSFSGQDSKGTLGTEIYLYVNGVLNTSIHTSCSQPIGPGLVKGDFEVISGRSREGGELCPVENDDDCACEGKVSQLTLQYNGAVADAQVDVIQKKDQLVAFSGVVQPGGQFSFSGQDSKGTLGTEIHLYINGALHTSIHTSCSQPIGPGLVSGDFEVISGRSREGGELCPLDSPDGDGWCEDGKPMVLTMEYTGESCAASNHTQADGKVICEGDPAGAGLVHIIATDRDDPDNPRKWFEGDVAIGASFNIDARNGDTTRLKSNTYVFIFDMSGNLLQTVIFHTSCSQPLNAGDQYGSLRLVDFEAEEGAKAADVSAVPGLPKAGCYATTGSEGGSGADALVVLLAAAGLALAARRKVATS